MGIKDAILKSAGKNPEEITIMNALKKCFYAEHKPDEESRMVKMIQLKNGESRERYGLHGSAILRDDLCYRAQVLSLFFKQSQGEELPLKTLAVFEEGNAIHEKWQRLFIRGGLGSVEDMDVTRFAQGVELAYTPDAIIKINNIQYVVEIKSMNSFIYQKSNEHAKGALQCLLYMYYCNIRNGFVLMENKNTQEFKIQLVDYDEQKIQPIIERLKEIQKLKADFIKTKKPPKRICENADCERAENCIMRDCCWNIGKGRISLYDRKDLLIKELKRGTGFENGKRRITDYYSETFSQNKDVQQFVKFIKNEFGTGGHSGDNLIEFVNYDSKGIDISYKIMNGGECEVKHINYNWNEITKTIIEMIESGEYL